jgi:hypothetical protein
VKTLLSPTKEKKRRIVSYISTQALSKILCIDIINFGVKVKNLNVCESSAGSSVYTTEQHSIIENA